MVSPHPATVARLPGFSNPSWAAPAGLSAGIPCTGAFSVRTAASYFTSLVPLNLGWMTFIETRRVWPPSPLSTVLPTTTRKGHFGVSFTQCAAVSTLSRSIREAPQ
jgi:hypothetical protein